MKSPLEVIAMHGWAGDARCWEPWRTVTEPLGWRWRAGERGYGQLPPRTPAWPAEADVGRRVVIGHSLGPHLVPPKVLGRGVSPSSSVRPPSVKVHFGPSGNPAYCHGGSRNRH
jgi:hypothetical protein